MMDKNSEKLIQQMSEAIDVCNEANAEYNNNILPIENEYETEVQNLKTSITSEKDEAIGVFEQVKKLEIENYIIGRQLERKEKLSTYSHYKLRNLEKLDIDYNTKLGKHLRIISSLSSELARNLDVINRIESIPEGIIGLPSNILMFLMFLRKLGFRFALVILIFVIISHLFLSRKPFECTVQYPTNSSNADVPLMVGKYWVGNVYFHFDNSTLYRASLYIDSATSTSFSGCSMSGGWYQGIINFIATNLWLDNVQYILLVDGQILDNQSYSERLTSDHWNRIPNFDTCENDPDSFWLRFSGLEHISDLGSSPGLFASSSTSYYACLSNETIRGYWYDHENEDLYGYFELRPSRFPVFERINLLEVFESPNPISVVP